MSFLMGLNTHAAFDSGQQLDSQDPGCQEVAGEISRFKLHFTPTSASGLNAVEGWFAQLERRALSRGVFSSVEKLKRAIQQCIETHSEHSPQSLLVEQYGKSNH